MAITRKEKEIQIQEIKNNFEKSHSFIVWEYLGLSSNEISELRLKIKKSGSYNKVYKNRIVKIAMEELGKSEINKVLTQSSSFLFTFDDNLDSLKEIDKIIKQKQNNIKFKAGFINGEFLEGEQIQEIASLPSKDGLLSMLLSVLQANIRNLAYSLSQVSEAKPEEAKETKIEEDKTEPTTETKIEEDKTEIKETT